MKLTFELYNTKYTVETESNDQRSNELKEIFSRVLVAAGYAPSVIDPQDGGHYEYVGDDEIVIKKEELKDAE